MIKSLVTTLPITEADLEAIGFRPLGSGDFEYHPAYVKDPACDTLPFVVHGAAILQKLLAGTCTIMDMLHGAFVAGEIEGRADEAHRRQGLDDAGVIIE